jgi:hypothetical protein
MRSAFRPHAYAVVALVAVLTACGSPIDTVRLSGGAPLVTPATLALNGTGTTATLVVSEAGTAGPFSALSSNAAIATVSPAQASAVVPDGTVSFTVTAGTSAGAATIAIADANGHAISVVATVTLVSGSVH